MKAPRGKGEGGVHFSRSKGLWVGSIAIALDENGRAKRRYVYAKRKEDLLDKLDSLKADKKDGKLVKSEKIRVAKYLERWLEDVVRPGLTVGSYKDYNSVLRNHVIPNLGGYRLRDLEPLHIQNLYANLERKGNSARNRQKVHIILSGALKQALAWNMIAVNPCKAVKPPKVERKEMHVLDESQSEQLLKAAKGDRLYALYVLAITTGLRQGELLGLKWKDLKLKDEQPTLTVCRTLDPIGLVAKDTKTPWSRRTIDLNTLAASALRDHQKNMLAGGNRASEWVFSNTEGNPYFRGNLVRQQFEPMLTKAELPRIRFHDLRHTAASLMIAKGVNIKVVSAILGHKDVVITLDRYGHILPSMQRQAVDAMDSLFSKLA
ncbi:MAG TPA: site-specific integrase [Candidatus Tumulicola sp.]|nr:site-specific integrase [Candidatus Tumulicola sp.]